MNAQDRDRREALDHGHHSPFEPVAGCSRCQAPSAARIPPGIKGVNVVQEKAPVDGVPEPGGLPAASSAATVDQLELVPVPRCDWCGPLQHTINKWHRETHKCGCPHRTDPYCQAHPAGCDDFTDIRNKKPSYQITELRGKTWADAFGGDTA